MMKLAVLLLLATHASAKLKVYTVKYSDSACTTEASRELFVEYPTDESCFKPDCSTCDGSSYGKTKCESSTSYSIKSFDDSDCSTQADGETGWQTTKQEDATCYDSGTEHSKAVFECEDDAADPCFSDETMACRLTDPAVPTSTAFQQCFGNEAPTLAERVPMKALVAGDVVLASPTEATRVIVNQHAAVDVTSNMITLQHEHGSLTLTADHVLFADGIFQPSARVGVDAVLEPPSKVTKVSRAAHNIVNPLTASGTILAAGPSGAPVLASTYPEWIAGYMLTVQWYPLPLSLCNLLSYSFPEATQAYYNAALEPFFNGGAARVRHLHSLKATLPSALVAPVIGVLDVLIAAGFAVYALASPAGLAAIAALALAARVLRKA